MYFNLIWLTIFLFASALNILFWRAIYALLIKIGMKNDEGNLICPILVTMFTCVIYVIVALAPFNNWYMVVK